MELRTLVKVIRAWKWLLIAAAVLAAGSGYLVSQVMPRTYESHATVIVGQSLSTANPDFQQLQVAQRLSQTYAEVATMRPILERVIDQLGLEGWTATELRQSVGVEALRDINLIRITASGRSPEQAAAIANTLAAELIAASPAVQGQHREIQEFLEGDLAATQLLIGDMQAEVDRLLSIPTRTVEQEDRLQTVQARLVTLRQTYASLLTQLSSASSNRLSVVEPAVAPDGPASPRPLVNTLLGALVGLMGALGLALVLEHLDDTLSNADEVESTVGLPTLGLVAQTAGGRDRHLMSRLVSLLYPRSPSAEAFRSLRTNIEFSHVDSKLRSILIASAAPREGKTEVAGNLAVVLAQGGKKTLLLDADLRKPAIHDLFRVSNRIGLTTLLRTDEPTLAEFAHETEVPGLSILTTGPLPPNPAELISSERMTAVFGWLSGQFDVIVVDTPPIMAVTDAAVLATLVDGTILVVRARRTRRAAVRQAHDALTRVGARVLGVVLSGVGREEAGAYYGYYGEKTEWIGAEEHSAPLSRTGR